MGTPGVAGLAVRGLEAFFMRHGRNLDCRFFLCNFQDLPRKVFYHDSRIFGGGKTPFY